MVCPFYKINAAPWTTASGKVASSQHITQELCAMGVGVGVCGTATILVCSYSSVSIRMYASFQLGVSAHTIPPSPASTAYMAPLEMLAPAQQPRH